MVDFPHPPEDPNSVFGVDRKAVTLAVPALDWGDLPAHRRMNVLWERTAAEPHFRQGDLPCSVGRWTGRYPASDTMTMLGSDGRYHLVQAGSTVPCGDHEHSQRIIWATNGTSYRIQMPYKEMEKWESGHDYIDWTVEVSGEAKLPAHVAGVERCPVLADYWPRPVDNTRIGRIRERLTTEFGPGCACCQTAIAFAVDHDPVTGLVRGYLCRDCNTRVGGCLHASGCGFADYLNEPPARVLGLVYPRTPTPREKARLRQVQEFAYATPGLADAG
ncbi:endonuclease domain-containing protein [Promicromonospora sp. NPDC057138]|uniref:endonuclease domain-containing protein n=1 Tax=Promicromonospora sp. NPDC057138 TaxID=3346031 RepID=UPI0036386446